MNNIKCPFKILTGCSHSYSIVNYVFLANHHIIIFSNLIVINNKYSWTLRHSISAIDHASLDGAV